MLDFLKNNPGVKSVKCILDAADGKVVGRTRFQKISYLLHASGFDNVFDFEYKHYGPFSRDLVQSIGFAKLANEVKEEAKETSWGGSFSIYTSDVSEQVIDANRQALISISNSVTSVVLELAATAAFLAKEGFVDPWGETANRKPKKATSDRLTAAKDFYNKIQEIETPTRLPVIP